MISIKRISALKIKVHNKYYEVGWYREIRPYNIILFLFYGGYMISYLVFYLVAFILVYLIYELFVIRKENALNKMKKSKDVLILSRLSKLDVEKVNFKKLVRLLALTNAFLISTMSTLVLLLNKVITNIYLWIIIGSIGALVVLIPLIMICYKFIGKKIKKEGK